MSDALDSLRQELTCQQKYQPVHKDILVVVRNQFDCVQKCVESILTHTKDFSLYLWDNASSSQTADYMRSMVSKDFRIHLARTEKNDGFIRPNNRLAASTNSPYIIALNSDVEVSAGWDTALVGWLQCNPECLQVGYMGGSLDEFGIGSPAKDAVSVEYIMGWGFAISRATFNRFGLFDDSLLTVGYFEDADLSLRIRQAGGKIHALTLPCAYHMGGQTTQAVRKEMDLDAIFERNRQAFCSRWAGYLANRRFHPIEG